MAESSVFGLTTNSNGSISPLSIKTVDNSTSQDPDEFIDSMLNFGKKKIDKNYENTAVTISSHELCNSTALMDIDISNLKGSKKKAEKVNSVNELAATCHAEPLRSSFDYTAQSDATFRNDESITNLSSLGYSIHENIETMQEKNMKEILEIINDEANSHELSFVYENDEAFSKSDQDNPETNSLPVDTNWTRIPDKLLLPTDLPIPRHCSTSDFSKDIDLDKTAFGNISPVAPYKPATDNETAADNETASQRGKRAGKLPDGLIKLACQVECHSNRNILGKFNCPHQKHVLTEDKDSSPKTVSYNTETGSRSEEFSSRKVTESTVGEISVRENSKEFVSDIEMDLNELCTHTDEIPEMPKILCNASPPSNQPLLPFCFRSENLSPLNLSRTELPPMTECPQYMFASKSSNYSVAERSNATGAKSSVQSDVFAFDVMGERNFEANGISEKDRLQNMVKIRMCTSMPSNEQSKGAGNLETLRALESAMAKLTIAEEMPPSGLCPKCNKTTLNCPCLEEKLNE